LHHPILACLAYLVWQPEYSKETDARWIEALHFFPIALTVARETGDCVQQLTEWVCATPILFYLLWNSFLHLV
jgi:hypothetical protein